MISLYGKTTGNIVTAQNGDHLRSTTYARTARVTTAKTLDGGVFVSHAGFSAGDSIITLVLKNISQADELKIKEMIEGDTHVFLSCKDGYFSGAISSINAKYGNINLTYTIREQLNE